MSIDSMYFVRRKVGERALWEQLAEECCELSHAALKMVRAGRLSENVTPVKAKEAEEKVRMEAVHVCMMLRILGFEVPRQVVENAPEWKRWERRLREAEQNAER